MELKLQPPSEKKLDQHDACEMALQVLPNSVIDAGSAKNEDGTITVDLRSFNGSSMEIISIVRTLRNHGFELLNTIQI